MKHIDDAYTLCKLEEMIRINSVVGKEGELAEYIKTELESLGLKTETQMVEPGRPNVYARLKGDKPGKRLNYNGHSTPSPWSRGGIPTHSSRSIAETTSSDWAAAT